MFKSKILPEEIETMPLVSFPGEIHVIESVGDEYRKAIAYLRKQKIIGFDTETRPVFSSNQRNNGVALLQLSGPDHAYLFRLCKMGLPVELCEILSDPYLYKVGAASSDDVRGLRHLRTFEGRGFIDLQKIAWEWGIFDKSVKKLAGIILKKKVSKTQQLSNWEADILNEAQKKYAATDAWVCTEMYNKLKASPKDPHVMEENVQSNTKEG